MNFITSNLHSSMSDNNMQCCAICLDRAIECKLKPCNHASFCFNCVSELMDRKLRCPLCRSFFFYVRTLDSAQDSDDEAAEYWDEMAANEEWRLAVGADLGMEPEAFDAFVESKRTTS